MNQETHQKVKATHLKRNAYLYIRQSTLRQVFENSESTKRQYDLRQRAIALGWPEDRIIVIDHDLGQSGASAADREGFQRLVTEVSLGRAGIVLGLEVSRLARNNTDWHRLLEICALTDTLILDEDGIYDPSHFNDRLLLGLKGTMSEAELHVLRSRLQGGIRNKARRGELVIKPPIGFVYSSEDVLVLDPDKQVQQSLRLLFETFRRTGSATATVKAFRKQGLLFPRRVPGGPQKGDLVWGALGHCQVLRILHNPRYAGAFVFGRHHSRKTVDGRSRIVPVPREEWETLIPEAHAGYLSWEHYEQNQKRLHESAQAVGSDRRKSPAREGPALLQGLILCGRCGDRMTVRYHVRHGRLCPEYLCQREGIEHAKPVCQQVPGSGIDEAIGALLIEAVSPVALEVALSVQQELQSRLEEADRLRLKQVERAQYEADLARRRYMRVEPEHRLVADSLEAEWNSKLRALAETQQERERHRQQDRQALSDQQRAAILALAADFPRLWRDPNTPDRERKRMTRLLLEDVTLLRADTIVLQIRFKGGATRTLTVPIPLNAWQQRATSPEVVKEIDRLLEQNTYRQIAAILNERDMRSGEGKIFSSQIVARIRKQYGLTTRYDRLRKAGRLTLREMAALLGITPQWVRIWHRHGILRGHAYTDKNECLYEHPGDNPPSKAQGMKLSARCEANEVASTATQEVQYEA
ncbi:MAG: recombinase family protein [Bryobacteraceae bacterium]|nr:recombinase family protein [Bryobacteraceae bacterium]